MEKIKLKDFNAVVKKLENAINSIQSKFLRNTMIEANILLQTFGNEYFTLKCPICKSPDLVDISPRQNNGIIGPGYHSWKTQELRMCKHCRIVIYPEE